MNSINDIGSLCRIKVNKMLSTLNSKNNDFFIPKYTLSNKNEEKYSYLNKPKGNSIKTNHNNLNMNMKRKMSSNNITTTEENYNKQPVDFIINHGVLVYQRNLKGEEVLNFGINNKYLKKNNFGILASDKTIYPVGSFHKDKNNTININKTHSNFKHLSNNSSKVDLSNQKQLKLNKSRQSFASMSDIPVSKNKNKNSSSRQKKNGLNLNNTHNSINSFNSFNSKNVKNYVISSKNKNINDINKENSNLN